MIRRPTCWRRTAMGAVVVLVAVIQAGCGGGSSDSGQPPAPPARQQKELTIGGLKRAYRVFAPPNLDRSRPVPVVLVLGGFGNSAESMVEATQFDREAIDGGFVVAYPDGVGETWNAGYCCGTAAKDGVDDVGFLLAVVDQIQAEYRTDPARVFVAGVSNGAMMGYRLACEHAERIAGVGSVAGAMILDNCNPSRPVPVLEIHGTADGLVPYGGGRTAGGATMPSPPTPALAERWAALNRCLAQPAVETKSPITSSTWTECSQGSTVRLVTVEGGGHTWFAPMLGPANGALDATHDIWAFFSGLRR